MTHDWLDPKCIINWFDVLNADHLKAYRTLETTGQWPQGFLPADCTFVTNWQYVLCSKLAEAYLNAAVVAESHEVKRRGRIMFAWREYVDAEKAVSEAKAEDAERRHYGDNPELMAISAKACAAVGAAYKRQAAARSALMVLGERP